MHGSIFGRIVVLPLFRMCGEEFYRGQIASLWVQTLLFGFYVSLFAGSMYVLSRKKTDTTYYLGSSIAMFALCAALLILDFVQILMTPEYVTSERCVGGVCGLCNQAEAGRVSQAIIQDFFNILSDFVFAINQLVADSLLIFRCYVLWDTKKWVAIAPAILLLANLGVTFAQAYCDIALYNLRSAIPASVKLPPPIFLQISALNVKLTVAQILLFLATNLTTTVLIAGRIWWMAKQLHGILGAGAGRRYYSAMIIILESGAIWSTSVVIWLIFQFLAPAYHTIPGFAMQQLMGIAPTLIIVRVGLGKSVETTMHAQGLSSPDVGFVDISSIMETKSNWAEKADLDRPTSDGSDRWI